MARARHARGRIASAVFGLARPAPRTRDYVHVPGGPSAQRASRPTRTRAPTPVDAFAMRTMPVTQGRVRRLRRVRTRNGSATRVRDDFADAGYLQDWRRTPRSRRQGRWRRQPVTDVSWFAAEAFCESEQARLPTWLEWEYVAAADAEPARRARRPGVAGAHPRVVFAARRVRPCRRSAARRTSTACATCTASSGNGSTTSTPCSSSPRQPRRQRSGQAQVLRRRRDQSAGPRRTTPC